jgi:hypothetical protein
MDGYLLFASLMPRFQILIPPHTVEILNHSLNINTTVVQQKMPWFKAPDQFCDGKGSENLWPIEAPAISTKMLRTFAACSRMKEAIWC